MIEGQFPQFPNFEIFNCFYFQMFPYSNKCQPFDILTFCNSDNLIFTGKQCYESEFPLQVAVFTSRPTGLRWSH